MKTSIHASWLVALLILSGAGTAYAEDEDDDKGDKGEKAEGAEGEHAGAEDKGDKGEKKEHHEESVVVGLDMVFGWGKVPFMVQNPTGAGTNPQTPTYSATDKTSSNVQSAIVGASA